MTILNIGVIGTGSRAQIHLDTINKLNDKFHLVAVCGFNSERTAIAAQERGVNPYTDLEELLAKEDLDVGLISVQAEGHHVITRILADHKVNIITETPIALTLPCIDMMIQAAEENGVFLEVSENVGRWAHERVKQKIVKAGLIGDVHSFYLCYRMGSYHGINAIRMITQREAVEVEAEFLDKGDVLERAKIRMEDNINGVYENKESGSKFWEVSGTKGSLKHKELLLEGKEEPFPIITEMSGEQDSQTIKRAFVGTEPEVEWINPYQNYSLAGADEVACADTLMSMHNAVVNGQPLGYDACKARKDMELLVAIRESATQSGEKVTLPLAQMTEYERRLHAEFEKAYGTDFLKLGAEHLKLRYGLPPGLKDFLYIGRLGDKTIQTKGA